MKRACSGWIGRGLPILAVILVSYCCSWPRGPSSLQEIAERALPYDDSAA